LVIGVLDIERKKMKNIILKIGEILGGLMIFLFYVLGAGLGTIIHIWTIVVAYNVSGIFAAMMTVWFPILAQIYWFIRIWSMVGTVINKYCLAILGYIGLWIIVAIGVGIVILIENWKEKKRREESSGDFIIPEIDNQKEELENK